MHWSALLMITHSFSTFAFLTHSYIKCRGSSDAVTSFGSVFLLASVGIFFITSLLFLLVLVYSFSHFFLGGCFYLLACYCVRCISSVILQR